MSFDVTARAYAEYMGRYSEPLARLFAEVTEVRPGRRALDVGCGPGALTAVLVERLGASSVAAIDPSESFVAAARERFPGTEISLGCAESLPYPDATFDAALAQLVVHFMRDPGLGLAEMRRVTRAGGVVAACVWDHGGDRGPVSLFWRAARDLDAEIPDESGLAGSRGGQLGDLFRGAGLSDVEEGELTVRASYDSFEDWWRPYTYGVGPGGAHVAGLDDARRDALRRRCAGLLPDGAFEVSATAWFARGRA